MSPPRIEISPGPGSSVFRGSSSRGRHEIMPNSLSSYSRSPSRGRIEIMPNSPSGYSRSPSRGRVALAPNSPPVYSGRSPSRGRMEIMPGSPSAYPRGSSSRDRVEIIPNSRAGSISRSRSRESEKNHALAVSLWGRGDKSLRDPPAHWGQVTYTQGHEEGDLFHFTERKGDPNLAYDKGRRRLITSSSWGHAPVVPLSRNGRERATRALEEFGVETAAEAPPHNSCQLWAIDALGELERRELVPAGTEAYWNDNYHKPSPKIADRLISDGRPWVPNPNAGVRPDGPIDVRYHDRQVQPTTKRLDMSRFKDLL